MRTMIQRQLVRWAFGRNLLSTMVAFSRWLVASLAVPAGGSLRDWRLWRALLRQDGRQQRGLRPVRRASEASRSLRRYQRLTRWRVFDAERPSVRMPAAA